MARFAMARRRGRGRKWLLRAAIGAVVLAGGLWLAFVPFASEPDYRQVAAWGGKGSAPGEFHDPTGIAVAGGEVFVSDARNGRIQVFDLDGGFRRQFGNTAGPGRLGRPMNLTVAKGELYVADYWNDRIAVFGLDGEFRRNIGNKGSGPGEFRSPGGVAVGADGDLFVADFYNHRVQRLRADGSFVRQWGATGESGISGGRFGYPTDAALGPDGTLYVADGYNDRVQAFAPDGALSHKWGGPFALNIYGPFRGWFATVTGIDVDSNGNVFVADFYNHRVQKFTADGTFLTAFGGEGAAPGRFRYAIAVAVADDGAVFVADFANNRVQKFRQGKEAKGLAFCAVWSNIRSQDK